jgi:hypothetical protein
MERVKSASLGGSSRLNGHGCSDKRTRGGEEVVGYRQAKL